MMLKWTGLGLFLLGMAMPIAAQKTYEIELQHLDDQAYPDNPNIGFRSAVWGNYAHKRMVIAPNKNNFNLTIYPENPAKSDTIVVTNIDLRQWIPTAPDLVGADKDHILFSLVSQEWNRNELRIGKKNAVAKGKSEEKNSLQYVHLVNNSLQTGLWELVLSANENGEIKPYFHAWFTFPLDLYESLFTEINKAEFKDYKKYLEHWHPIHHHKVNPELWRSVQVEHVVAFENKNQLLYEPAGEYAKKHRNILNPPNAKMIQHYLTDSTRFAGLTAPGIYVKTTPQLAHLGRIAYLDKIYARDVVVNNQKLLEFELVFHRKSDGVQTHILMGGISRKQIPTLDEKQPFKGFQMPIAMGVRSFVEDYETAMQNKLKTNVFYSMVYDHERNWVDRREIGVEGLLFHFDSRRNLHVWVLAFEQHCVIGHYMIENF